jgi:hypothetical protein
MILRAVARHGACDGRCQPIALTRHRLDIGLTIGDGDEDSTQCGDRLLEAIVGDGEVAPARSDEIVLRNNGFCVRREVQQDTEVAVT